MSDLDKLIEAVEAGTARDFRALLADSDNPTERATRCGWAAGAFKGNLYAAQRLHEALLPGWDYCIDNVQRVKPLVYVQDDGGPTFDAEANTPARAWLLAVLRALRDKGTP